RDLSSGDDEPFFLQSGQKADNKDNSPSGSWKGVRKHRKKDGQAIELEIRARRMTLPGREIVLVLTSAVTERARAAEALLTTKEVRSRLLKTPPAVVYVNSSDGCTRLVNRAWEECFGLPRARALGLRKDEVFSPELAARFLVSDKQVLHASAPV